MLRCNQKQCCFLPITIPTGNLNILSCCFFSLIYIAIETNYNIYNNFILTSSNQWSTTGLSKVVVCSVYGKVHIKDPLLLIEKSSLCGGSGFPSKKCVNVTI